MSKTPFSKKRCHFWFWFLAISAESTIFIAFPGPLFWSKKHFWPKQIVCTKMRAFFSLPDTNSVRQFLLKIYFLGFFTFWMTTAKKTVFTGFWGLFHFVCFSFFCFYFSNVKKTKTKNAIFFSKTSFLTSPKFCKNTILAQCDTICVFKNTTKHY